MTYADLPEPEKDKTLPSGAVILAKQPALYCLVCDQTFSANPGDYWNTPKDQELRCADCSEDLTLVWTGEYVIPYEARRDFGKLMEALWNS